MNTIDYTRQRDFFDPLSTNAVATIVGCGGIGSFTAFALAKLGVSELRLLDFDHVEEHNIPNQLFLPEQVGESKVEALAATILGATPTTNVTTYEQSLQDGIPRSTVVISALDSMQARAELWEQVKYKLDVRLFLDGRLGGENVVLYSVNPSQPSDVAGYEATLHSDEEGVDLPCTGRAIIDVGFAVASLITRAVRRSYAEQPLAPITYLDQNTLELLTGDWYESDNG